MLSKVKGIYEFTGLTEFADLPLKYYSSGMYMRLAFAIATEIDPDILLIDESLPGVGDTAFVDKAFQGSHPRPASTVFFARRRDRLLYGTPSLREMCTRGLWLKKGRVVADGPINDVVDAYLAEVAPQKL